MLLQVLSQPVFARYEKNLFAFLTRTISRPPTLSLSLYYVQADQDDNIISYDELLHFIAQRCDGMSGASLAGVARAAASRALERAVTDFTGIYNNANTKGDVTSISDCLVTKEDFENAINDVLESINF